MNPVVFRGETLSAAAMEARIQVWQGRLSQVDAAVVARNNQPDLIAMIHAAARAGTTLALLNTRLAPAEIAALRGDLPWVDELRDGPPRTREAAVHTLLFTSGTTGVPKAAQHSVANHVANARAAIEVLGIDPASRFVCTLPLFHVGGLAIAVRCALTSATLVLHEKFDAEAVARDLEEGATHVSLVATTLQRLLATRRRFPAATVLAGGGPVPAPLLERAREAGLRVLQTYGLTEAASMVTCEREPDGKTAGTPMPGMEVRVVGGEIEVRGPAVMRGYRGMPEVEGWFRTGDLGELDGEGRLLVHARRGDLIVSGGENVYPAEVEAVLLTHQGVREVAVVPAPDERWGQVGVAYLSATATEQELREFLRSRLAGFKIPQRFIFVDALPRLPSGKLDRRVLYPAGAG